MATWCNSYLDISGAANDIADVRQLLRGEDDAGRAQDVVFTTLLPDPELPDDTALMIERSRLWGTKWQPSAVTVEDTLYGLRYSFRTPYSPPVHWAVALSKKFPDTVIRMSSVNAEQGSVSLLELRHGDMSGRMLEIGRHDPRWRSEALKLLNEADSADLLPPV